MEITGTLRRNDLDKWEIVDDVGRACVLSSGAVCELEIAGHWIRTRLEYCHGSVVAVGQARLPACGSDAAHPRHYYAVEPGVRLSEGLPARVTDRRDWYRQAQ